MRTWFRIYKRRVVVRRVRRGIKGARAEFLAHKDAALAMVKERIAHFCTIYPFVCGRVSIKNQKTRWGSCSRKGNLNFHYRIALLPEHVRDYVIVHELCHLGEFNHSRNFWDLVARAVPDHKTVRAELKHHSLV